MDERTDWLALPPELWVEILSHTPASINLPSTLHPLIALGGTCRYLHTVVAIPMIWSRIAHAISTTPLPRRPNPSPRFVEEFDLVVENDDHHASSSHADGEDLSVYPTSFQDVVFDDPPASEESIVVDLLEWRVQPLAAAWAAMWPFLNEGEIYRNNAWACERPAFGLSLAFDPLTFARVGAPLTPLCACGDMDVVLDARGMLDVVTSRHRPIKTHCALVTGRYEHNGGTSMPIWGVLPPPGFSPDLDAVISFEANKHKADWLTCPWCGSTKIVNASKISNLLEGFVCLPHRHVFAAFIHWCM